MDNNLVFGPVFATEAYLNTDNDIVIGQSRYDDSQHVVIPVIYLDALIARLQHLKQEAIDA